MRAPRRTPALAFLLVAAGVLLAPQPAGAGRRRAGFSHEKIGHQTFASPQSNPVAVCANKNLVFAAATTSNRVDVIETLTFSNVGSVPVGVEPVGLALRPDGLGGCGDELWVSNHVSDSVSVIDIDPASASYLQVVETVQDVDPDSLVTAFDEPVGIAFQEDGSRAFVALSSTNEIAVVDTTSYQVVQRLTVNGQEPRALAVRNGRLYVAAFESDNRSELSSCANGNSPPQCTLDPGDALAFATSPNLPGLEVNIVIDPQRPDRDLFVWDLANLGAPPQVVEGVGTLLYGLAVSPDDVVYVTQADALNAVNGLQDDVLATLQNRMFRNRVAVVDCSPACGTPSQRELDPPVGSAPAPGSQLATPFGVALSADGSVLVASAAGSSRVFSMDAATGTILDRQDVGAIPFGLALDSSGATGTLYVLNTLDNSVSVVALGPGGALSAPLATVGVGNDPTPDAIRRGRIAFNDADASTQGTFSCASCHPFGNTDQLIWRIGGQCSGCTGDEPRTTMPVRGLRDTLPLHWDGTLGDPFGGPNGAGTGGTDCALGDADGDHDCFLDVVNASLAGVMCDQGGSCPLGGNTLTAQEKDDMAFFLAAVSYPPARRRPGDDAVTASALNGFDDFFRNQGGAVAGLGVSTCADSTAGCHEFPLGAATNSQAVGQFDAPTMRGMTDRFVHFSNGFTGSEEFVSSQSQIGWTPAVAMDEFATFDAAFVNLFTPGYNVGPSDMFEMFEEASTGHSGALGRQVTLNSVTTAACTGDGTCPVERLLAALEDADDRGVVNFRGAGLSGGPLTISWDSGTGLYRVGSVVKSRAALVSDAQAGLLLATLTGHLRGGVTPETPQPLLSPQNAACSANAGQNDPVLPSGASFTVEASHVASGDAVFVDGQRLAATLTVLGGSPACADAVTTQLVSVNLSELGLAGGLHLLQVQNAAGLLSNEVPFTP